MNKTKRAAKTVKAIKNFSLDDPTLAPAIAENALSSGGFPYDKKLKRKSYEHDLRQLQIELLKLQYWAREKGERIVILFEGRDTAGKGGTILRLTQHLNPRHATTIALSKPTDIERNQWYFQRYVDHLPTAGNMTIFDRSWYNRAGVERVMGFADTNQIKLFLREVPHFEQMLVRDGIRLFKFWLTIGQETQLARFHARRHDPLKSWKLSPIDIASIDKWNDYTAARTAMFAACDTPASPWIVVRSNDKKRARLNVIRHFLRAIRYDGRDMKTIGKVDLKILGSADDIFGADE